MSGCGDISVLPLALELNDSGAEFECPNCGRTSQVKLSDPARARVIEAQVEQFGNLIPKTPGKILDE